MIQVQTKLKVADNTGAKIAQCIKVLGGNKKRYATIGDVITVAIKEATPHFAVKKGDVLHAVIVRIKKNIKRKDGTCLRFGDNACVIVDKEKKSRKAQGSLVPWPEK